MEILAKMSFRAKVIVGVLVLFVVFIIFGVFLYFRLHATPVTHSSTDLVYATPAASGSTWYEIPPGKNPISHSILSGMDINGIARGGGKTFILAVSPATSASILYEYTGSTYIPIYTSSAILRDLSVNSDGSYVAFTAYDTTTKTAQVSIFDLATKTVTPIGIGFGPAFLGTAPSVLYMSGHNIFLRTLTNGSWSKEQVAYFSQVVSFKVGDRVVTDGKTLYGFTDPALHEPMMWELKTLQPLAVTSKGTYSQSPDVMSGFTNESLIGVSVVFAESATSTTAARITQFSSTPQITTLSLTHVPYQGRLFIGVISQ